MNRYKSIQVLSLILLLTLFFTSCAAVSSNTGVPDSKNILTNTAQPALPNSTDIPIISNTTVQNSDVSFGKEVTPIFQTSCVSCHGGERTSKGLDLKTYESLLKGSQNGAMVIPGDAANSKLLQSILSGKMPKRGNKLTQDQILLIQNWINSGAKNN